METKMYVVDKPYREMELQLIEKYGEKWMKIYRELRANGYDVKYNEVWHYGKRRFMAKQQTHGESYSRLYQIWHGIKSRCYTKCHTSYHNYGEKGINVCDEWRDDYIAFRDWALTNGYRDDLTIDRIDNGRGYEPSNCRWATPREQSNNKNTNHLVSFNGETHTIAEWSRIVGLSPRLIKDRLKYPDWSVEKILFTPPRERITSVLYNGEMRNIADLAKEHGITPKTLTKRLKKGWNIEKALVSKGHWK